MEVDEASSKVKRNTMGSGKQNSLVDGMTLLLIGPTIVVFRRSRGGFAVNFRITFLEPTAVFIE
jgi:hypothetical protein